MINLLGTSAILKCRSLLVYLNKYSLKKPEKDFGIKSNLTITYDLLPKLSFLNFEIKSSSANQKNAKNLHQKHGLSALYFSC